MNLLPVTLRPERALPLNRTILKAKEGCELGQTSLGNDVDGARDHSAELFRIDLRELSGEDARKPCVLARL